MLLDGGNITGSDTTTTLTVSTGLIGFAGNGVAECREFAARRAKALFFTPPDATSATIASSITGSGTSPITKGGDGTLILNKGSQFTGQFNINEGAVNIRDGAALGSPSGATIVNNGAQLQLQGNITVIGEPVTINGTGPGNGTGGSDGALLVVSGNPKWTNAGGPGNGADGKRRLDTR